MNRTRISYTVTLASFALLAVTVIIWVLQIENENNRLTPFLIGTLPLLLVVRGLLHERVKTYQATVFIALLYLIHGSAELFESLSLLAASEVIAAMALMTSAAFHAKWISQKS